MVVRNIVLGTACHAFSLPWTLSGGKEKHYTGNTLKAVIAQKEAEAKDTTGRIDGASARSVRFPAPSSTELFRMECVFWAAVYGAVETFLRAGKKHCTCYTGYVTSTIHSCSTISTSMCIFNVTLKRIARAWSTLGKWIARSKFARPFFH